MVKYLLKNKLKFILLLFFSLFVVCFKIYFAYLVSLILDSAIGINKIGLLELTLRVIIFVFARMTVSYIYRFIKYDIIKNAVLDLRIDVLLSYFKKNLASVNSSESEKIYSTITNDIRMLENDYFNLILNLITDIASLIISSFILFKINGLILFVILILCILQTIIPRIFRNKLKEKKAQYVSLNSKYMSYLNNLIEFYENIKLNMVEKNMLFKFKDETIKLEYNKFNVNKLNDFVIDVSFGISQIIYFISLILGAYLVSIKIISPGIMVGDSQLITNISGPFHNIVGALIMLESSKAIVAKIKSYISSLNNDFSDISINRFTDCIYLDNVSLIKGNKIILDNINLKFEKNKKYCIVGESGSGKSTILRLISSMEKEYSGNIYIDGINYRDLIDEDIFKIISFNFNNKLLNDTIKNNISLYREGNLEKALAIGKLEELVSSLEDGIETKLVESDKTLSAGELQRIILARCIYRDYEILILDEGFSNLDINTSNEIEKKLLEQDITFINVTHKMDKSLLSLYDEVYYIKDGKVSI